MKQLIIHLHKTAVSKRNLIYSIYLKYLGHLWQLQMFILNQRAFFSHCSLHVKGMDEVQYNVIFWFTWWFLGAQILLGSGFSIHNIP